MPKYAVVTGGSSGLGKLIVEALQNYGYETNNWSPDTGVDVRDQASIFEAIKPMPNQIDMLINCAGINIIDWFSRLTSDQWDAVMDTNAKGIFNTTQCLLKTSKLRVGGTVLNIVSNASHMPMTHSAAYNASKGAAEILTRQMARELGPSHGLTVFGISPNKLKGTGMSKDIEERVCELRGWTPEEAAKYQLAALPAGEETDPETLAEFIGFLLSTKDRHKYLAGCIIQYGA